MFNCRSKFRCRTTAWKVDSSGRNSSSHRKAAALEVQRATRGPARKNFHVRTSAKSRRLRREELKGGAGSLNFSNDQAHANSAACRCSTFVGKQYPSRGDCKPFSSPICRCYRSVHGFSMSNATFLQRLFFSVCLSVSVSPAKVLTRS